MLNEAVRNKYSPELESMEGAAFHYTCIRSGKKFAQLRTVSNYVGDRNKENWNIDLAITNLNIELIKLYDKLTHD